MNYTFSQLQNRGPTYSNPVIEYKIQLINLSEKDSNRRVSKFPETFKTHATGVIICTYSFTNAINL